MGALIRVDCLFVYLFLTLGIANMATGVEGLHVIHGVFFIPGENCYLARFGDTLLDEWMDAIDIMGWMDGWMYLLWFFLAS